jgi:hypothetical protein
MPFHITRPHLFLVFLSIITLASCGGDGGDSTSGLNQSQTPKETLQALQSSGALPNLDRSSSIKGPDANNNGIRDDIETWINNQNLPPQTAAPLRVLANVLQTTLTIETTNQQAVSILNARMDAAIVCITSQKTPSEAEIRRILRELEAITANTKERTYAYIAYNESQNGTTSKLPAESESCNVQ